MIIYNVTINVEKNAEQEWVQWMKQEHIPEVMETGCFEGYKFCQLLKEEEQGTTYAVQYFCQSMDEYERYQDKYAAGLQQKHVAKYENKCVAFRTLLKVLDENV